MDGYIKSVIFIWNFIFDIDFLKNNKIKTHKWNFLLSHRHWKFVEFILNTVEDLNENVADDIMLKLEEYDIENKDLIEYIITESINNEYSGISENIDDFRNESIMYTSNSIEYLPMGLLCVLVNC